MIYTERSHLTVLELPEERETVTFAELIPALMERPSQVVYVVRQGVLWGIVPERRIANAGGGDHVNINRQFKYVQDGEYMRAKRFFEGRNEMTYLPVLDGDGRLLGEYRRYDCLTYLECFMTRFSGLYASEACKLYHPIILIKPCSCFSRRQRLFLKMKKELELRGAAVEVVEPQEALERDLSEIHNARVLTVTPEETMGMIALHHMLALKSDGYLAACDSYDTFFENIEKRASYRAIKSEISSELKQLQEKGVSILGLRLDENENGYLETLKQAIQNRCSQLGVHTYCVPPMMKRDFLGELFDEEHAEQTLPIPYTLVRRNDFWEIKDTDMRFFHTRDGDRLTVGQPAVYERCVYMYGPCLVLGSYVEDQYTIPSLLQKHINNDGIPCRVFNKGGPFGLIDKFHRISLTPLKRGDIIVLFLDMEDPRLEGLDSLNLTNVLEKNAVPAKCFFNTIMHSNHEVNRLYADAIFEKLYPILKTPVPEREPAEALSVFGLYFSKYFSDFNPSVHGVIGSIVMNCNPFTMGHRWLIEQARKQVDFLIIFVVEEDRSICTFEERLTMVYKGVSDLDNIKVVPSGENILSQDTFPEYFIKVEDEQLVENVERDITIFAEQIAPKLNISCRFVGEEPEDAVTNSYNAAMKRILPAHGIDIIEIPRKELDGEVISASRVRRCLEANDQETLAKLAPQSTVQILYSQNE